MKISGFQPFSLNEYPGEISAIIFTQGCNFRCRYCYNPDLIPEEHPRNSYIEEKNVLDLLKKKRDRLTAVTLTGGEPLLQSDIMEFLTELKSMGYKIKINTNGSCDMRLKYILEWKMVDFIAMDIKATKDKYEDIIQRPVNKNIIDNSIKMIMESGIPYVFHTVMDEDVLNGKDIEKIKRWIKNDKNYKVGVKK